MWFVVALVSATSFVAVVAIRSIGGLTGWRYLVVLALMMVMTPVARNLSQRILIVVVLLAGTAPFMWWFTADVTYLDRGTTLFALTAASLTGALAHSAVFRLPFRRFLPHIHVVDALPVVAAAASTWVVQTLLFTKSLESTVLILTRSWDFAPHFNMFNMIRNHGSVIALLPSAPDGSQWSAASYPQGYHALLATLAEVVSGSEASDVARESILFLRLVGVVTVLGTLLVVASLTSLPVFRRSLLVTLPYVSIAATAWIVGPGAIPVFGAFPNFGLGVALCVAVVVIVQLRRLVHPVASTALLVMAVTAVAHGWILLLVLCLPSVLVYVAHLFWHRRELGWRKLALQSAVLAVGMAGVLGAVWQLRKLSAGDVLTTTGGIAQADTGVAVLCIIANAFVALAFYSRRKVGQAEDRRGTLTSLHVLATPLFAAILLIALAAFQLMSPAGITYYFYKSFLAVELVAIVCTVIGAAELWSPLLASHTERKSFIAASLLTSLGATHFFGLPFTGLSDRGLSPTAHGSVGVLQQADALSEPSPQLVQKLARMAALSNERPFIYVGFDEGFDPQLAAQWSLTLQGTWTESIHTAIPMVRPLYKGPSHVPESIDAVLTSLPDVDVVVNPELVPELRAWRPQYASRIITY
ncbi:hypothetical protein ASPU41_19415 [Arthrobacter sp. U41]|nr:hypothetical protein ASPU41_19415 [Arthrobacter sp. U41]